MREPNKPETKGWILLFLLGCFLGYNLFMSAAKDYHKQEFLAHDEYIKSLKPTVWLSAKGKVIKWKSRDVKKQVFYPGIPNKYHSEHYVVKETKE